MNIDPNTQPAKLVIEIVNAQLTLIPEFALDLFENERSVLRGLPISRRPGIAEVSGLHARQALEVVISAPGYLSQRRRVVLQPANNTALFMLGEEGMDFYEQEGIPIPFRRQNTRHIVLKPVGVAAAAREMGAAKLQRFLDQNKELVPRTFAAEQPEARGQGEARPHWHRDAIVTDLHVEGHGAERKQSIAGLARHLRQNPELGKLAVLVHDRAGGGSHFSGEITVAFTRPPSASEIGEFERRYDLRAVSSASTQVVFEMEAPDADFTDLVARIKSENDWVKSAEPVVVAFISPTAQIVPADYLFPEQWDHPIIQTPEAWFAMGAAGANAQFGSSNIIIAVADAAGVEMAHPDLAGNVNGVVKNFASYDFVSNAAAQTLTGTHGTRCAGAATAAADRVSAVNATFTEGLVGVAGGCRLVGQLILPNPLLHDESWRWLCGFRVTNPAQLSRSVDVSSNSFRAQMAITAVIQWFLEHAADFGRLGRGISIFYSAGNDNGLISGNQAFAMSNRVSCITSTTLVTAGAQESRAPYSNFGPQATVCAPSSSLQFGVRHAPPNFWGGFTTTVTNAAANAAWADGNYPSVPALNAGALIQQPLNAFSAAGLATLVTNADTTPFATASAVMVDAPGNLSAEGLRLTGIGAATHQLNVIHSAAFPNSQQAHNAAVIVTGGRADYISLHGGTSYSTPVVAGLAALLLSAKNTLSWVEVREILRTTSRKVNVGETSANGQWKDPALLAQAPNDTVLNAVGSNVRPKAPPVSSPLAANVNAPADPKTHLNHGQSILQLNSAAGFEIGDPIRITDGVHTEFHVIEGKSGNSITIDALRNNFGTAPATTVVAGGVRPVRSDFYGHGRINARQAVLAALAYNHADRDLVVRNSLNDTGLVDTNPAATPILSPDIWVRNQADPPLPAPPYDQPGPHQNPVVGSNRFIYARIKNIGQGQANLDAWVHFYVALSDHTAPPVDANVNPAPGITTPFLFPGDPGSATQAIVRKSWCDTPVNDITAGTVTNGQASPGIGAGTQGVYQVRDNTVLNVFNQIIPAGSVSAADANNINTGVTVVRVQWNLADLPPAGTALGIYLLAYVAPVDGQRSGRGAGLSNNMSYREIAFADFDLFDDTGAALDQARHAIAWLPCQEGAFTRYFRCSPTGRS